MDRVPGAGAEIDVLTAIAFGTPGRQEQQRGFAIERLNRPLRVYTEQGRLLRRMQIRADHIGRRSLSVRRVRGQVAF